MPQKAKSSIPVKKFPRGFQIEAIYDNMRQDKYGRYAYSQMSTYIDSNLPLLVTSPETSEKVFTFLGKAVGFQLGAIILEETSKYLSNKYSLPEIKLQRKGQEIQKYEGFRDRLDDCDKKMISWVVNSITEDFEVATSKLSLRKFDEFTQFCNICNDFVEWFKDIKAQGPKDEALADIYSLLHKVTKHYGNRLTKNNLTHSDRFRKSGFIEYSEITESYEFQKDLPGEEIKFIHSRKSFSARVSFKT